MALRKKRDGKTSTEQYEEYLSLMEADIVFRTGTKNPTVDTQYLSTTWEDLCMRLNSKGSGPKMDIEGWKKRFTNWKNTTRAKYRKLKEVANGTGGGPGPEQALTPFEERGIAVWGRVTVCGTPKIDITGGLQELELSMEVPPHYRDEVQEVPVSSDPLADDDPLGKINISEEAPASERAEPKIKKVTSGKLCRSKPYKDTSAKSVDAELLAYTNNSSVAKNSIESERLKLEKIRLQFEIAKYKYEHPDFLFDAEF